MGDGSISGFGSFEIWFHFTVDKKSFTGFLNNKSCLGLIARTFHRKNVDEESFQGRVNNFNTVFVYFMTPRINNFKLLGNKTAG